MTGNFVVAVYILYFFFFLGAFFEIANAVEMKCGFEVIFVKKRYKTGVIFSTVVKAEGEYPF